MKLFAALAIAAVNGESDPGQQSISCWTGDGETIAEFTANAVEVECSENEICQMTVR